MPTETEVAFQGQLTQEEFTKIQWMVSSRLLFWWPWMIFAAFAAVILTGGLSTIVEHPADQAPGLLLVLLLALIGFIAPRLAIHKAWTSSALTREPFSGALSEDGFIWKGPYSEGLLP